MNIEIRKSTIERINALHTDLQGIVRTGIDLAIEIGQLLSECKSRVPHGQFSVWVATNCSFTLRTAQRYMRVYQHRDRLTGSNSLTEAYKALQDGKGDAVSFLDVLRAYREDTLNEDLAALNAFKVEDLAGRLPDPTSMEIEQLVEYLKELEEAHGLISECVLRTRKKLGELMPVE